MNMAVNGGENVYVRTPRHVSQRYTIARLGHGERPRRLNHRDRLDDPVGTGHGEKFYGNPSSWSIL